MYGSISDSMKSKVRELPSTKRKELDKVLATPQSDSWKILAKELGKIKVSRDRT